MKPTTLCLDSAGESKKFHNNNHNQSTNEANHHCDNNDSMWMKIFDSLPMVEAAFGRIDPNLGDFDHGAKFGDKNNNSNNFSSAEKSSTSTTNAATTSTGNSCNSSNNGEATSSSARFRSPFSAMDFSMLYNSSSSNNNNNNSDHDHRGDTTASKNFVPSTGNSTNNKIQQQQQTTTTKSELVQYQDYNLWSGLNNNIINHNFVQLSANAATIIPSIFTIKSIVNISTPTTSQPQSNQVQQRTQSRQQQNTLIKKSLIDNSSSSSSSSSGRIDSRTNIAATLSSTTSSSLLRHPRDQTINTSDESSINCSTNTNKQDNNVNIGTNSREKFQFISPTSSTYDGEKENKDQHHHQQQHHHHHRIYLNPESYQNNRANDSYDLSDNQVEESLEEFLDEASEEALPAKESNPDSGEFYDTNYCQKIFKSDPKFKHLTLADKTRFERLFREIDVDGNGVIDFNDLLHALEEKGIQATHENVKHLILRSDVNLDGDIDFYEFVSYCLENEKQLHIIFKDIDINDDGHIDAPELVQAFTRAGIKVDESEALRLVRRIKADSKDSVDSSKDSKKDNKLELNYTEFRDYLLLHPADSLQDLMRSWRFGTFVDFGEDGIMPVDFSEKEIRSGMWWRHMVAGGVAGAVSRTSTAPLDRLKVFLQVRGAEFNGLSTCLKHMIQEGGVLSLWRGNGINVIKIAPETAIKFMAFDQLKRLIHSGSPDTDITIIERFVAGSLAGAVSQTAIYPMEVLKTRFCLRQTGQYRSMWDAAKKIYSNGGIKNFYRGYIPNLIGIIPYAGIDLTIYETLKKMYMTRHSLEDAPVYVCLTCGTVSSTFGQIASYPLALIRTRMQSESGNHRSSMVDMFRTILKQEGVRGLYRGITANIMKVAPAVSISYVVYEYTRRPLGAVMS